MPIVKSKFKIYPGEESEDKIDQYYEMATQNINSLLQKYSIRNAEGELEEISANSLKMLLTVEGFFQDTPLKGIFFAQKQQFVPHEIVQAFQNIISPASSDIKAVFFNLFLTLLTKKKWVSALSEYFEKQYNLPKDGIIVLNDIKDFSLGVGIYRLTFQLSNTEEVIVFLKQAQALHPYNEMLYFQLQKEFFLTANHAKTPYLLSNKDTEEALLLSPFIRGLTSDIVISLLEKAYRTTNKIILKKALEILIEEFVNHAVLGDILGRNDRHLQNSLMALVSDGIPQKNTLEYLIDPEKILWCAEKIATEKSKAISLIDIDLKWLLEEKNFAWALIDIDFGLSEINLLSLLPEFRDYDLKNNQFLEKRKEYIEYYFDMYCQKQDAILEQKELLFSAIRKNYPFEVSGKKSKILKQRIEEIENNQDHVIKVFERYLLNFRLRLIHKITLFALYKIAKDANNQHLLNALKEAELLKFIPIESTFVLTEANVFNQLECFRGVLSKKDRMIVSENNKTDWETVAANISKVAKNFDNKLFQELEKQKQFVELDSAVLLQVILAEKKVFPACVFK